MADTPDFLTLKHHRDQACRRETPIRRVVMLLIALLCLAGLLNAFGQRPQTLRAAVSAASLKLYAPSRVRGGLYYEVRFTIDARQDLKKATLVLDPGWIEGITINTIEPSPIGEASRDGKLVLELGHIPAGKTYLLFVQEQVNPTNVGHRSQDVALYDGDTLLTSIDHEVTVFP
ncbi:MAG: hypothetical protein QOG93_1429 [Gaiellaceae bacterium]|jgi:hypothetical protein|nr:hypothetical protein [Gaiellaceae bacterium]